ncbi:MBL fold metallo-hydrolase [Moraxella sp. FZLJ2107]|uniref:MBL fold metallo-hydrolase n=1 Tax=unclassified Moraxella TaxID=2685852 RepID=UPI0020C8859B|nr:MULTISPECIES: MBL fold metallo-hydrolase [unclassified Moraxella]UTO05596.1 MBL fold metallo-hydrolase [Moraxella sp. FZLJ2107]UTO22332.1 MBL fold metallo-hydrolase [Moraxella sp. FZLJ2109]
MIIKEFFDKDSQTFSYVAADDTSGICAIIDSVLGFDMPSARTDTTLADDIIAYINAQAWTVAWHLETHIHADHLSAASYLKSKLGGKIAISHRIDEVQSIFGEIYHLDFKSANAMMGFDYFFEDDEYFNIGTLPARALATPGHTPACMSYWIDDAVFVGDTLFMPDYGTARCDFPKGSSRALYQSIQKLYQLPDDTTVYLCHDYLPPSRQAFAFKTTIGEQKQHNIHANITISQDEFVAMRDAKDRTLAMPKLLLPSIQFNLQAGNLPQAEDNDISYLKIPLNQFR